MTSCASQTSKSWLVSQHMQVIYHTRILYALNMEHNMQTRWSTIFSLYSYTLDIKKNTLATLSTVSYALVPILNTMVTPINATQIITKCLCQYIKWHIPLLNRALYCKVSFHDTQLISIRLYLSDCSLQGLNLFIGQCFGLNW